MYCSGNRVGWWCVYGIALEMVYVLYWCWLLHCIGGRVCIVVVIWLAGGVFGIGVCVILVLAFAWWCVYGTGVCIILVLFFALYW